MSCQKEVVDFTGLSDDQVLNHFHSNKGKTCGRFYRTQLNRRVLPTKEVSRPSLVKMAFGALLAVFSSKTALGQEAAPAKGTINYEIPKNDLVPITPKDTRLPNPVTIEGVVIDSTTTETLIGASVLLNNTEIGCSTDIDGRFSLVVPSKHVTDTMSISVSFIGYETKRIWVGTDNTPLKIELGMDSSVLLGDIVVVGGCFYNPVPLVDKMETLKVKTWLKSIGHW